LINTRPRPLLRQQREVARIWLGWLFVFPSAISLDTTLREDAFNELAGWFDVGMLLAPVFSEFASDGGFEDGSFVAFEVGLDALEVGDGFVEAGELFFDFRDDALLLVRRCDWDRD
jgi:hypothetical protein